MQTTVRVFRICLSLLLIVGLAPVAGAARRRPMYRHPPANQNNQQNQQQPPQQPAKPQGPKVVSFQDLANNLEFYFASDTGHYIRYTKISATSARTAVSAVNRVSQVVPISPTQQVITVDEVEKAEKAAAATKKS